MPDDTALAVDAIKTMYDIWKVDPERVQWVGNASAFVHEFYGFDWWPADFKVEVRVHGPHPELERPTFRLSVRTDYLCDVDVSTPLFRYCLAETYNVFFALFAACTHPTGLSEIVEQHESPGNLELDFTSTDVWLCSTAYLDNESKDWLPHFLAKATIMQLAESHFMTAHMATGDRLDGRAHRSQFAGRAPLASISHLLEIEDRDITRQGKLPSKWIGTGEFEEIVEKFGRFNPGMGTVDNRGLLLDVPFADRPVQIILNTNTPHPRFGNGVHVVLVLSHLSDFDSVSKLAIEMNYLEDRNWCRQGMPFMGSWIAVPDEEPIYKLSFHLFVPNLFYQPGLAENLVAHAISRTQWAREFLRPDSVDIPLDVIIEERKSWEALLAKQKPEQRSRGPWRTILVGGLVTGVLLLIAFFLSNNPSNPFRTRAGTELKLRLLATPGDDAKSVAPVSRRDTAS